MNENLPFHIIHPFTSFLFILQDIFDFLSFLSFNLTSSLYLLDVCQSLHVWLMAPDLTVLPLYTGEQLSLPNIKYSKYRLSVLA